MFSSSSIQRTAPERATSVSPWSASPRRSAPRFSSSSSFLGITVLLWVLFATVVMSAPAVEAASASVANAATSVSEAEEEQAWNLLRSLRTSLRAQSPLTARFRQTFVPADFDEGETEDGVLAISLPKCMRWDYHGDFAKSFLLCDDWAYTWNPGEPKGRRTRIDDELALDAPGLDFFLLSIEQLEERYGARLVVSAAGHHDLQLVPHVPTPEVTRLDVRLDADARVVLSLSYADAEGNRTTFELSGYETGAQPGSFSPPATLDWEDS